MKIVIDIPDGIYKKYMDDRTHTTDVLHSVRKGKPLPEHHGRLVDADVLKEKLQEHHDFFVNAYGSFEDMTFKEQARVDEITNCIAEVVNAPNIIEGSDSE